MDLLSIYYTQLPLWFPDSLLLSLVSLCPCVAPLCCDGQCLDGLMSMDQGVGWRLCHLHSSCKYILMDASSSPCLVPLSFSACTQSKDCREAMCFVVIFHKHGYVIWNLPFTQFCLMNHLSSCDCLIEKSAEFDMWLMWYIGKQFHLRTFGYDHSQHFIKWLVFSTENTVWVLQSHNHILCMHLLHHNLPSVFCNSSCPCCKKHRRLHFCSVVLFHDTFLQVACFKHKKHSVSSAKPPIHPFHKLTSSSAICRLRQWLLLVPHEA